MKRGKYHYCLQSYLTELLEKFSFSLSSLRNSRNIAELFNAITWQIIQDGHITSLGVSSIQIRVEAMKNLVSDQLCLPQYLDFLIDGTLSFSTLSKSNKAIINSLSSWFTGSKDNQKLVESRDDKYSSQREFTNQEKKQLEVESIDLSMKVKLIFKEILTFFIQSEQALTACGHDEKYDRDRALISLKLILLKNSAIIPQIVILKDFFPRILAAMTCHILITHTIDQTIKQMIQTLTNSLLSILTSARYPSTIEENTDLFLTRILSYFQTLRSEYHHYTRLCRQEEVFLVIPSTIRASLHTESYNSPEHLLQVYASKYRDHLQNILLSLQSYDLQKIRQAEKDIRRERMKINREVHTPQLQDSKNSNNSSSNSSSGEYSRRLMEKITEEILKVIAFLGDIDNSNFLQELQVQHESLLDSLFPHTTTNNNSNIKTSNTNSYDDIENPCSQMEMNTTSADDLEMFEEENQELTFINNDELDNQLHTRVRDKNQREISTDSVRTYSDVSDDLGANSSSNINNNSDKNINNNSLNSSSNDGIIGDHMLTSERLLSKEIHYLKEHWQSPSSNVYQMKIRLYSGLLKVLFFHCLLACSRTFAAGDAFLLLHDLYGGDGCTFRVDHNPSNSRHSTTNTASTTATASVDDAGNTYDSKDICQLTITSTGIKVSMKERYQLLSTESLDVNNPYLPMKPLAYFECTTTTSLLLSPEILFHAVETLQQGPSSNLIRMENPLPANRSILKGGSSVQVDGREFILQLFRILVSHPELISRRTVTIEPYLPEDYFQ